MVTDKPRILPIHENRTSKARIQAGLMNGLVNFLYCYEVWAFFCYVPCICLADLLMNPLVSFVGNFLPPSVVISVFVVYSEIFVIFLSCLTCIVLFKEFLILFWSCLYIVEGCLYSIWNGFSVFCFNWEVKIKIKTVIFMYKKFLFFNFHIKLFFES